MNRRTLLGAAPVALLVRQTDSAPADHPDADLIALCAEFCAFEKEGDRVFDAAGRADPEQAVMDRLYRRQEALARQSHKLTATTLEGSQARARALLAWVSDYGSVEHMQAECGICTAHLLPALLRDLAGVSS